MMNVTPRVIIAAGGTGGHLWPAVSLAQAMQRLEPRSEFLFVGAGRPVEAKILELAGFKRVTLESSGVKGRGPLGQIKAVWQCLTGVVRSLRIFDEFKPNLFFGTGGYVTVPVGVAAKIKGVPLLLHEQNSRPGLSNRILARLAMGVYLGFEAAEKSFPAGKTLVVGNPVRSEIEALHGQARSFDRKPVTVLVTGGSQGARGINRQAAPALAALHRSGLELRVVHQAGEADREWVEDVYKEAGLQARVAGFFQDMASLYAEADLAIGRAGALTLAELAEAKLPSVLVPLPTAADDHQTANAQALTDSGAAVMMAEKDLTPESFEALIGGLLGEPGRLEKMSGAAAAQAGLNAAEAMARDCLKLIEGKA